MSESCGASAPVPSVFLFDAQQVRVLLDEKGNPLFCGPDVCDVLGYQNAPDAVAKHCRPHGIAKRYIVNRLHKRQELTFLTEGNLYRLILKSHKPEAERFEGWVCDEVLPTIRKTGRYEAAPQPELPKRGRPKSPSVPTPIPVALPGYGSWLVEAEPKAVQISDAPTKLFKLQDEIGSVIVAMNELHQRVKDAFPKPVKDPLAVQFIQQRQAAVTPIQHS